MIASGSRSVYASGGVRALGSRWFRLYITTSDKGSRAWVFLLSGYLALGIPSKEWIVVRTDNYK